MVSATTGLKIFQGFGLFMGIMMTTFPEALLGIYGMDFFDCPAASRFGKAPAPCDATKNKAIAFNCFNGFGVQIMLNGMMFGMLARDGVNKKAQSVALLVNAVVYAVFIVSDFIATLSPDWPEAMPKEGPYTNFVMWTGFIVVALLGWKDSGQVTPNFEKMMPSGRFGNPLLAGCVNLLTFGVPLVFFRSAMVAQFGLVIAGLLVTSTAASANTLNFIGNRAPLQGAKSAISIQGEGTCSYHRQSPATFTIGGGQPQPIMVPGTFGHGTALPTPSSVSDVNTVFGVFVTVPLSRDSSKNCDEFYDVQRSRAKLKLAKELHNAGQITDAEFSNISKEAYATLE